MKGKNLQPRILYPARLSFRFVGEIKIFPDKQKLKEFSTTKPALQQIAKGTSLGRKHKERKSPTENKPQAIKKLVIGSYILITILNVNGLNAPTKKHGLTKQMKTCACMHFHLPHDSQTPQIICNYFILSC